MNVELEKRAAVEFLRLASAGKVDEAAHKYLATGGVHHNVYFAQGWNAIIKGMKEAAKTAPKQTIQVKHVIAEGDMVAVLSHVVPHPGAPGISVVHWFRFEGDKIAEFWDVAMEIPAKSPNKAGPF